MQIITVAGKNNIHTATAISPANTVSCSPKKTKKLQEKPFFINAPAFSAHITAFLYKAEESMGKTVATNNKPITILNIFRCRGLVNN